MHTWHDILKQLDPTDFQGFQGTTLDSQGTADRVLEQALLAVEAQDWMEAGNQAELGQDLAGYVFDDAAACAVFQIVGGVGAFNRGNQSGAVKTLETAITVLHRHPRPSDRMNEAIASISASIMIVKMPCRRPTVIKLAHNALGLLTTAMNHYASVGNHDRWWYAKDLHEWVGERLDGTMPVKYIEMQYKKGYRQEENAQ